MGVNTTAVIFKPRPGYILRTGTQQVIRNHTQLMPIKALEQYVKQLARGWKVKFKCPRAVLVGDIEMLIWASLGRYNFTKMIPTRLYKQQGSYYCRMLEEVERLSDDVEYVTAYGSTLFHYWSVENVMYYVNQYLQDRYNLAGGSAFLTAMNKYFDGFLAGVTEDKDLEVSKYLHILGQWEDEHRIGVLQGVYHRTKPK